MNMTLLKNLFCGTLIALGAMLLSVMAEAADKGITLQTVAGKLFIQGAYDHSRGGVMIKLNGKPVLKDSRMSFANVVKAFPEDGSASILVLGMGTGGTACPLMLRVIDLGGKQPYVSPEFGTCYDDVEVMQSADGAIVITQPNVNEDGESRWSYSKAKLKQQE